jgi:hypothetical protein
MQKIDYVCLGLEVLGKWRVTANWQVHLGDRML